VVLDRCVGVGDEHGSASGTGISISAGVSNPASDVVIAPAGTISVIPGSAARAVRTILLSGFFWPRYDRPSSVNGVLQNGQKLLMNQRLLWQFGHFIVVAIVVGLRGFP
jgi:hypothetical protein